MKCSSRFFGIALKLLAALAACVGCSSGGGVSYPEPEIHWKGQDSNYDNMPTRRRSNAGPYRKLQPEGGHSPCEP